MRGESGLEQTSSQIILEINKWRLYSASTISTQDLGKPPSKAARF
jgi:hypothetical protein